MSEKAVSVKTRGFSNSLKQKYISSMYKFCVVFVRIRLEYKTTNLLAFFLPSIIRYQSKFLYGV